MSADRHRWRELVYLTLRFPVGVATFVAATTCITTSIVVGYAPFYARYDNDPSFGNFAMSERLDDIASNFPWAWLLAPLGAMMLIAVTRHHQRAIPHLSVQANSHEDRR